MAGSRRESAARFARWTAILGSTLTLITLGQAFGHDPGRGPPFDTGPPSATLPPEPSPAEPSGDGWHQNLIRERPAEVRWRTAQKELKAGRITEALLHLQAVLDSDEDVFVRLESQSVPTGARFLADQLLGSLPRDARANYETLQGPTARRLLTEARASGDPRLLVAVTRRYFRTVAGGEACLLLAHRWADHGNFELAAACWQRLLDEPVHRQRLKPLDLVAAAACLSNAGRSDASRDLVESLSSTPLTIGEREITPRVWIRELAAARRADSPVPGPRSPVPTLAGSIPALGHPLWTIPLAGKSSGHITSLVKDWEPYQLQNGLPIGASHLPVLVGDRLIFRDFEGIRAISAETGRSLWFYAADSSLSRDITPRPSAPPESNPDPNDQMRWLVGDCLLGTLASDGRSVFAIDRIESDVANASVSSVPQDPQHAGRRQSNLLLALPMTPTTSDPAANIEPLWRAGGRLAAEDSVDPPLPLAGHYFIGPPLPVGNCLYAVTEFGQQLFLSCLDAGTGQVSWTQSLCSVAQPITGDYHRFALICSPVAAEGMLVVPTQAGILVAVEPITGRLLWASSHDDGEPQHRQQMSAWPYSSRKRFGHRGYANVPVIDHGRIVYLPAHSEYVHCVELATGKLRWRVRREDLDQTSASEYVAAADGAVLLVGRRSCRGLDLETGAERYRFRLGTSPAGRGVRLGSDYHIPLDDGRVVCLDVASGRARGWAQTDSRAPLGNLIASRDLVFSMGRTEITAWPQAESELARLDATRRSDPGIETVLAAVRLELSLGRVDRAQARLATIASAALSEEARGRIRAAQREIVMVRLNDADAGRPGLLTELSRLAATPEERSRYLLERALFERAQGDPSALAATARAIAKEGFSATIPLLDDPSRSVAAAPFVRALFRGLENDRPLPLVDGEPAAALRAGDPAAARQAIDLSLDRAQSGSARLQLAELLIRLGHHQQAEMLLLQCREGVPGPLTGAATRLLSELWRERALFHDAARLLEELQSRFADIDVGGVTGADYARRLPENQPAAEALRRLLPPAWSATDVRISETRASRDDLLAIYKGNGVQPLNVPRHLPFDLFENIRGESGKLTLVDRQTGAACAETIQLPGRYTYPVSPQPLGYLHHSYVGHFVPMGTAGAVHGISLLERKLVWTTAAPGSQPAREMVRIGPTGPGYCVCQTRQHLFVVDPADGRLLWHRDDLEALSGLMTDTLGIIGDEQALVVFAGLGSNGVSSVNYTLYATATGEELRRGRLDVSPRLARRALGRRLFHTTSDGRRLRVWDPLADRFIWDQSADEIVEASHLEGIPPGTKVCSFVRDTDEAAFVTRNGQLRVVDLACGADRLEIPLSPAQIENLTYLRVSRDQQHYQFDLRRSAAFPKTPGATTYALSDATIPRTDVEGELCVVDRKTRNVLWTSQLGTRSILQLPDFRLPVLVTLFRVRKDDPPQTPTLAIEVLDARSGAVLASRDDLFSDSLLQVGYEREPGLIVLRGGKTEIRIEFGAATGRLNTAEPRPTVSSPVATTVSPP